MTNDDLAAKRITMRDAPVKKANIPKLSKPMTTHDLYHPVADIPKDPKAPGGPMITTGNVDRIMEQAAMRSRMGKARAAKMDKLKEEIEARAEAEEKKEKIKAAAKKAKPEEKKAPESPPEAQPDASDTPGKEVKPDPLKEAVDKASKEPATRKSYKTKKKDEDADKD